jgi:glutamyl-tRNA reductase
MTLFVLGLNHRTAPIALREQLAFSPERLPQALPALMQAADLSEAAILSTCNRTEIYAASGDPEAQRRATDWLASISHQSEGELSSHLYEHDAIDAARHAFRVACGLDSMVLGEPQILGQMKEAARQATALGATGTWLNQLFQRAFAAAKAVRTQTLIGANTVSMSAAAVQLAERIFESISEQRILFIGAGEMVEQAAAHFCARNPAAVTVANRTIERGQALAERFNGQAITLDEIPGCLAENDIIISSTASPLPIIGLGLVERAIRQRRHRPMFMVDFAVPRDIEPEAAALDDVFLYTVDDLAEIVSQGREARQTAVTDAEALIDLRLAEFESWRTARLAVPLIRALREHAEGIAGQELAQAQKRVKSGVDPEKALAELSARLTHKFLHAPTKALAEADPGLLDAATRIFDLSSGKP